MGLREYVQCRKKAVTHLEKFDFKKLLDLEKQKRGFKPDRLAFIGMADTAGFWWCGAKSLFQNRGMELEFFKAYLSDRLTYSLYLNHVKRPPLEEKQILEVGDDIKLTHIEQLLKELGKELVKRRMLEMKIYELLKKEPSEPRGLGVYLEVAKAEKYPSIRWNFGWKHYQVIGIPDGITDELVYEFKTTAKKFLAGYMKPVALAQADLYGYFFKRKKKRVQIYIRETGEILTWENEVDLENAEETLKRLERVDLGELPKPPVYWKCNNCEFRKQCPTCGRQP